MYIAGYKSKNCAGYKEMPKLSDGESSSCFSKCFYIPLYGTKPSECESLGVIYDTNKELKEAKPIGYTMFLY